MLLSTQSSAPRPTGCDARSSTWSTCRTYRRGLTWRSLCGGGGGVQYPVFVFARPCLERRRAMLTPHVRHTIPYFKMGLTSDQENMAGRLVSYYVYNNSRCYY